MKKLFLILLFLVPAAHAGQAIASWGAVTKDTNGNTLPGPVTYTVYSALQGQSKTVLVSGLTTLSYTALNLVAGTTTCFEVTANVVGLPESARSNEGCKAIVQPGAPVITVASNVYQRKPGGGTILCGRIALGVKCGADAHIKVNGKELFGVPRVVVTFTRKDNGTQTLGICA